MQSDKILNPVKNGLCGVIEVPGDKSISHRAVMFGSIASGKTIIHNFLKGEDCISTVSCFKKLGIKIEEKNNQIIIEGSGWEGLKEPSEILDVGNSGTTTRLLMGILAGRPFHSIIIGDDSIAKRPMKRVTEPLRKLGCTIDGRDGGEYTPLSIRGGEIEAISYTLPVASAQVKSAIILAGLQANGVTTIIEPMKTRDHTEKMIRQFGGTIHSEDGVIKVPGKQSLMATEVYVPGDISSAAFFMVAAAITPNSSIKLPNVGLNPTRIGILDVLKRMGACIKVEEIRTSQMEPVGTITVETSELEGIEISGDLIPALIDELPVIALLATQAKGTTIIRDAEELKVKETNRIDAIVNELKKLGADIEATEDGMIIHGKTPLHGATVDSWGDHRIGMTLAIASIITSESVVLNHSSAINVSYPSFFDDLYSLFKL